MLGDPDLLERSPVVGRALAAQELPPVRPLEAEVHLEPAVVGRIRIVPAALVAVDAEPRRTMRRMTGAPQRADCASVPEAAHPEPVAPARIGLGAARRRRPPDAHHVLPAPGHVPVAVNLLHNSCIVRRQEADLSFLGRSPTWSREYGERDPCKDQGRKKPQ